VKVCCRNHGRRCIHMKRFLVVLSGGVVAAFSWAGSALATAYQMDGLTTGIGDQITEALAVGLPVAGTILAFFVGWRIVRRVVK